MIALVQSLVSDLALRYNAGETLPVHRDERIAENAWPAARDGLTGHLIVACETAPPTPLPTTIRH